MAHKAENSGIGPLRGTDEQFRILVDSVEDYAIYILDPLGNVSTWNSGAAKIKGYSADEIIGKNYSHFYTAEDVALGKPQRNLKIAESDGHVHDKGLRVRKDGSTFWAEVAIAALRDESGNLRGFSKVTRDITEQLRARSAEAARIAAEKASKAKDEFLAALSHELRTPLTPALAAAGFLVENFDRLPKDLKEEVEIIRRNIQLQARLIDDLLDLTRATRGRLNLRFERVDAHAVIEDALRIAKVDIGVKKLRVSTKLDATEHHLWADAVRIEQVFWNLINNAVKFTPQAGTIDIRTSNDEHGHFEFEITDTGIGIEPSLQRSLFKPFQQADASVARQFGGLGLGLVISKHIVDLHGGVVAVASQGCGHGSTFKVTLDSVPERVGNTNVSSRMPTKATRQLRILVVEDHADTRRTLTRLLTHFGHNISAADSTQSALHMMDSAAFDVVLSDIGLPDGSGYEVITHGKRTQNLKGVALTGFGSEDDIRRGKDAGFDFHLTKPVDFHELRSVLDQVS